MQCFGCNFHDFFLALSYESYDCELPDLPEEKERYKMFK